MRFRFGFLVALALMASTAHAQQQDKNAPPKRTDGPSKAVREKFSYAFGMMIGRNMKKQDIEVDSALMIQGFKEALAGGKTLLTEEQAVEAIQVFEREVAARQQKEAQDFLASNIKKQGVKSTPSGLQYKVIKAGKGVKPKKTDAVTVQYRGTFPNGSEFDNSGDKPFTIAVEDVIPGWQEALQMMEIGSRWQLVIPANLAYGEQGQPPIGPNATLIFDLELLQIAKAPAANQQR